MPIDTIHKLHYNLWFEYFVKKLLIFFVVQFNLTVIKLFQRKL